VKADTIKRKVNVFISSNEDASRYAIVRKALKHMLEATNLVNVYVRETDSASSSDIVTEYLEELSRADVVVFLISNKDNASQGVVNEYQKAKEQKKKCLFIFCKDGVSGKTQIQLEQEQTLGPMYRSIESFDDLVHTAYESVLNDISKAYTRIPLQDGSTENNPVKFDVSAALISPSVLISPKFNFDNFALLDAEFARQFGFVGETPASSDFDKVCAQMFQCAICVNGADDSLFSLLEKEILAFHEVTLHEVLKNRIEAIRQYFEGNLQGCVEALKAAYECAKDNENIPNWLLLDILIDCRNFGSKFKESQGTWGLDFEWQKLINENKETVYYPVLDRFAEMHSTALIKLLREKEIESPYTISFGGNNDYYKWGMQAFVVAVSNASLTQILSVDTRLIEAFASLCRIYNDHKLFIELIRLLLIRQPTKDIDKYVRVLGARHEISSINELDTKKLIDSVLLMPTEHERKKALIAVFRHFGYYFSDEEYNRLVSLFWEVITDYCSENTAFFNSTESIIEALKSNWERIDRNRAIDFIIYILENRTMFIKKVNSLLSFIYLDIDTFTEENRQKLFCAYLGLLWQYAEGKRDDHIGISVCRGLEMLRRLFPLHSDLIDANVHEYHPKYYLENYSLEFDLPDESGVAINHIEKLVNSAHSRNRTQGSGGKYFGYASNPLDTLSNMIRFDAGQISEADISSIIEVAKETLHTSTQEASAKISAVELLLYICNLRGVELFGKYGATFHNDKEEIEKAFFDSSFSKDSAFVLSFYLLMLDIRFGNSCTDDLLSAFSIPNIPDYTHIKMSKALCTFSFKNEWSNIEDALLYSILQFVLMGCNHNDSDVRLHSIDALFEFLRTKHSQLVSEQLSRIMDNCDSDLALKIVHKIYQADNVDEQLKEFVIQKGKVSNDYRVRKRANQR